MRYEVGLTKFMIENAVKVSALFPYAGIKKGNILNYKFVEIKPKNPTMDFGFDLFISNKFPFLKKELVEKNTGIIGGISLKNEHLDEIIQYVEGLAIKNTK